MWTAYMIYAEARTIYNLIQAILMYIGLRGSARPICLDNPLAFGLKSWVSLHKHLQRLCFDIPRQSQGEVKCLASRLIFPLIPLSLFPFLLGVVLLVTALFDL